MTRRFTTRSTSALLLVLATACAAPSQTAKKSSAQPANAEAFATASGNTALPDPNDEITCDFERTVGTMIPTRICRSKSDLDKTRVETQQMMRNLRPPGPRPDGN
jgi:hypothetical protein